MMNPDPAPVATPTQLADIEAVRQAKARYFRGVDSADSALVRSVLAEDCMIDYLGCFTDPVTGHDFFPELNVVIRGRAAWVGGGVAARGVVTVHQAPPRDSHHRPGHRTGRVVHDRPPLPAARRPAPPDRGLRPVSRHLRKGRRQLVHQDRAAPADQGRSELRCGRCGRYAASGRYAYRLSGHRLGAGLFHGLCHRLRNRLHALCVRMEGHGRPVEHRRREREPERPRVGRTNIVPL